MHARQLRTHTHTYIYIIFKMDLILENWMTQIHLNSYLLRGKWSTVAVPIYNSRHFPCSQKLKDRDKSWSWFDTICTHGLVVATGKCQDQGSYWIACDPQPTVLCVDRWIYRQTLKGRHLLMMASKRHLPVRPGDRYEWRNLRSMKRYR